ncbi:MAG: AI-2E family transporter [Ferruginibacter sp.]|nr:AI-2E family transporter [Ferruginibacter sp.]
MEQKFFNDRLRQIFLLGLIVIIAILLIAELSVFIPGILGGITLYILSRNLFFDFIQKKKWKKGLVAMLFIFVYVLIISIPVYLSVYLILPKIQSLSGNENFIINALKDADFQLNKRFGISLLTVENAKSLSLKISSFLPQLLNSTANILTNTIMMFFLFYYLLIHGKEVESYLGKIIPLKKENINILAGETKMMIKANALGIPFISVIQGIFATLGYWIFGVQDWALWGFMTGIFAFFPLVGTMIIWVPLVLLLYSKGLVWQPTGLAIYSGIVTGNVDYLARLGLMKKLGNVHPIVTILGVIVGLNLFGFMGLIFGPLLISYFIILVKIYINEFDHKRSERLDGNADTSITEY